jgi:hypothetical protein
MRFLLHLYYTSEPEKQNSPFTTRVKGPSFFQV